jgi:hypothetical protein
MSFKPIYTLSGLLHGEPQGALHTTNYTNAALRTKDYMVKESGNLKSARNDYPSYMVTHYSALSAFSMFSSTYPAQESEVHKNEHKKTNP